MPQCVGEADSARLDSNEVDPDSTRTGRKSRNPFEDHGGRTTEVEWSEDGHPHLQGVRQRNTEVDGLVSRSGEKIEIQVYLLTLVGSMMTMPAAQLCAEQAGALGHVTFAGDPDCRASPSPAGYDATHQVQAGTSTEVLHNFETCQNR